MNPKAEPFVLVMVEDNELEKRLIHAALNKLDYHFTLLEFKDCMEVYTWVDSEEFALPLLMFMDYRLPLEDGLTITRKLVKRKPELVSRIVLMSGGDLKYLKRKLGKINIAGMFMKPFQFDQYEAIFSQFIEDALKKHPGN